MNWIAIESAVCGLCLGFTFGVRWGIGYLRISIQEVKRDLNHSAELALNAYVDTIKERENLLWMRKEDRE